MTQTHVRGLLSASILIAILNGPAQATPTSPDHSDWPMIPDWVLAGDFDADGTPDLLAATRNSPWLFLRSGNTSGDGAADFYARSRNLPGRVTALTVGEINRRDGLNDIALAIDTDTGPKVMVFESPAGAFDAEPERFELPAVADELSLGKLDEDAFHDLWIQAGDENFVILGRDRRLSWQSKEPVQTPKLVRGAIATRLIGRQPVRHRSLPKRSAGIPLFVDSVGDLSDIIPGDGVCETAIVTCTLRAAIDEANASVGLDTIGFSGAVAGPIALASPLTVTDPVILDGTSHPDFTSTPVVELDASGIGSGSAINLAGGSDGSMVKALVIHSAIEAGIKISGSDTNTVAGCYLGTDVTGTSALGNGDGIKIDGASIDNVLGGLAPGDGNLISGNSSDGIELVEPSSLITGTLIQGNRIGTTASGLAGLGNGENGIKTSSPSNTIGGTTPAAKNLIAFNGMSGIAIGRGDNLVQGNWIGLAADGTAAGNLEHGVLFIGPGSGDTTIGGTVAGSGNVISANGGDGIRFMIGADNLIQGNFIGTDPTGTLDRGNSGFGVCDGCGGGFRNTVGGSVTGAGNVISANTLGGYATGTTDSVVQGNTIGLDVTGEVILANGGDGVSGAESVGGSAPLAGNLISGNLGVGVRAVTDGSVLGNRIGVTASGGDAGNSGTGITTAGARVTIGGTATGEANVVAFNGGDGVAVTDSGSLDTISGNSIFSNDGLGIDLDDDAVTANDPGDPDAGTNNLQNFPVLTTANPAARSITGTLDSNDGALNVIEVFASTACDASGHGEGRTYLGSGTVTTIDGGAVAFTVTGTAAFTAGDAITATATNPGGSTSEFSICIDAVAVEIELFSDGFESGDTTAWSS